MSGDTDASHGQRPDATDDAADFPGDPDRRSVLRGTVGTVAALGAPLLGACTEQTESPTGSPTDPGTSGDAEVVEQYSQPAQVADAVASNEGLFDALAEIGFFEAGGESGGLQVSSVTIDGEPQPELRLYVDTPFGTLTAVVSPEGVPLGGYAQVVTTEERMAEAPFEWPADRTTELRDGRRLGRIDRDGWTAPQFEGVDPVELVTELCGTPMECTGPTTDGCAWINCCGKIERTGNCPGEGDVFSAKNEACEADDFCEKYCWNFSGTCQCIRRLSPLC